MSANTNPIMSLRDAVAANVRDGDTVAMEGFTHLIPHAAGHEIIRQGRRNLHVVRMTPDMVYDQLIGSGCVTKVTFSWAALLPVRLYRAARFRDPGQDRPFRSLRWIVEHEALCALKAHVDGVATPRLATVSEFPPDSMLMAFDSRPMRRLADLAPEEWTPDLLASVWSIVDALVRSHTVHHRLNAESLLIDDNGRIVVAEFTSASLGVTGPTLSTDIAEVLALTAAAAGPQEAVAAAVVGVGHAAVAAYRLEADRALVERDRAVEVGDGEGDLSDVRAGVDGGGGAHDAVNGSSGASRTAGTKKPTWASGRRCPRERCGSGLGGVPHIRGFPRSTVAAPGPVGGVGLLGPTRS